LEAEDLVVVAALPVLAMSLVYIWMYTRDPWSPSRTGMPTAFVWAPLLAAAVTALVYLVARAFGQGKDRGAWLAYTNPVNLLIVFSQLVDGFATALGIDLHGYREKHVLSAKVIGFGREAWDRLGFSLAAENATFSTFVPVKLLVSLLVIYALDVKGRDDPDRNETVIGLAKFAIIMVGIGPGVRDFARLSLGV
ncbi:MAG TPA: DUF63 family protein, partial [Candidatus Thermoplasmatota archaeon]|nr:DUF63 family protein [Candidatus Thermoplasmatota archaeon]